MQATILLGRGIRVGTSVSLGMLVTAALLLLMCALIAMDPPEIDTTTIKIPPIVLTPDRVIEEQRMKKEVKPADPAPQPKIPELTQEFINNNDVDILFDPPSDPGDRNIGLGLSSGTAMAIFKVAPQYPRRAVTRGVEGFVDLIFDITATGKTENIRVIYAQPPGYFEHTSIKTLAKWKYEPAMDDGIAQAQKNQTTRFTYELDK